MSQCTLPLVQLRCARDPSLRLKNGCVQDDAGTGACFPVLSRLQTAIVVNSVERSGFQLNSNGGLNHETLKNLGSGLSSCSIDSGMVGHAAYGHHIC